MGKTASSGRVTENALIAYFRGSLEAEAEEVPAAPILPSIGASISRPEEAAILSEFSTKDRRSVTSRALWANIAAAAVFVLSFGLGSAVPELNVYRSGIVRAIDRAAESGKLETVYRAACAKFLYAFTAVPEDRLNKLEAK